MDPLAPSVTAPDEDPEGASDAFITTQRVRFGHIDPAGIAYFPHIYNYIHEAFEELWESHLGVRYHHLIERLRLGFPLVHAETDFHHGLRFGDRPRVRITCFHLARSALGLRYRYDVQGHPCLEARMTTACVDLDSMKSVAIPPAFRERFAVLMERDAAAGS